MGEGFDKPIKKEGRLITKKDICLILRISASTLNKLLNKSLFEKLKELNYRKTQKIMTSKQVSLILNEYCYFPED